jgi:cyclopropane-fatty-acyl-phospholipid synthase
MLPTKTILAAQGARAGLRLTSTQSFGASYALTLAEWRKRFLAAWTDIAEMGFSERFRRLWNYYLCYCEAGFRAASIDVGLYVLTKD